MARLLELSSDITRAYFGPNDIFHDRSEQDDLALQKLGEKLVPELTSGKHDRVLDAAFHGNVGSWKSPRFQSLLENYHGPIPLPEAAASYVTQLRNTADYRFSRFVVPAYPPLAKMARIQGDVQLQLKVEAATGEVNSLSVVSGHTLLIGSAAEAARRWRFEARSLGSETVDVTIEYLLRCQ